MILSPNRYGTMKNNNNPGMRDWIIFIQIARTGSLGETSRQMDLSTAAVSKVVTRLESYLGTKLFTRTPKGMLLTEAGKIALHRAEEITHSFKSLFDEIGNPDNEIKGNIRLTAPALACEFFVNKWAYEYTLKNPKVRVFIDSREHYDITRESPELDDLVIRSGKVECEDLVHRRLNSVSLSLCASSDYLSKHQPILYPRDLEKHNIFHLHNHGMAGPITLKNGKETHRLESNSHGGVSSNNLLGILNLAIKGYGICLAPTEWLNSEFSLQNDLEILLPEWLIPDRNIWLIWRHRSQNSRLFTDFRDYITDCWNKRYS